MCEGYIESATMNRKEFKTHNTQEQIKQDIKKIGVFKVLLEQIYIRRIS